MQTMLPRLTLALVIAFSVSGLALAQTSGKGAKVATVNGVAIPKYMEDAIVRAQEAQGRKDTPEMRAAIRDRLIALEVIVQEAKRKGLNKSPDTVAQIEITRANLLAQAFHADYIKQHPISDETLKAEYDKINAQRGDKEYKARHILVETEVEAKEIIEKLNKGEKFADLAKASKDAGSKDRGGELDWNVPTGFVQPFSDTMVKLEKGKYANTPVKTQFGWHVIQLEDVRQTTLPDFAQVKPKLAQRMQEQMFQKAVADLRAKAKVE